MRRHVGKKIDSNFRPIQTYDTANKTVHPATLNQLT